MLYSGPGSGGGSVSVELFNGRLYVNVDDGSTDGFQKYLLDARSGRVDDGQPHRVTVELENGVVWMSLDDSERFERLVRPMDLRGADVYLGGVDDGFRGLLPWHVWTRDGPSYLGCLWSVRFDGGRMVDLVKLIRDTADGIQTSCGTMPDNCTAVTCRNDGVCSQSWVGPVCDCSRTEFTGTHCHQGTLWILY